MLLCSPRIRFENTSLGHEVQQSIALDDARLLADRAQNRESGSTPRSKVLHSGRLSAHHAGTLQVERQHCEPTLYGVPLPDVHLGRG